MYQFCSFCVSQKQNKTQQQAMKWHVGEENNDIIPLICDLKRSW